MATTPDLSSLNIMLVGGAVRDQLLGRAVIDRDYVVVGSSVAEMLALNFSPVGKDFPVFLHPTTKEEYALARTEKKSGSGYTGFQCYSSPDVTIEEDLLRRDLTINAMALSPAGQLIDPYGGKEDLENRIFRHVSAAFIEDPLRVLRIARFAARYHQYGFTIASETLSLMTDIAASGELQALSAERIFTEMQRSLNEPHPEIFFQVLRDCKALSVIFPELDKLWGIPNPAQWHPEICSGIHTMMVLQQAVKLSNKAEVRFAALCHDLGKILTPAAQWPSHHGHEKAGCALIKKVCQRLKAPSNYLSLALKVSQFHCHTHTAFQLKASTVLNMFNQLDIWRKPDEFADFLLACEADSKGRLGFEQNAYPQATYLIAMAEAARAVKADSFIAQGLQGKAIKDAIDQEKTKRIDKIKQSYITEQQKQTQQ